MHAAILTGTSLWWAGFGVGVGVGVGGGGGGNMVYSSVVAMGPVFYVLTDIMMFQITSRVSFNLQTEQSAYNFINILPSTIYFCHKE